MTVPEITVRDRDEYAAGHIPGARLVPLPEIDAHLPELRGAGTLQVVCQSGNRSARAVEYLAVRGLDAVSVAGGTKAWIASGRPVDRD